MIEERIVKTTLKGTKEKEILESVIGQLSDGIWENSLKCSGYWSCIEIIEKDGFIAFEVEPSFYYNQWGRLYANPYAKMSNRDIASYFARKIQQIVNIENKDTNGKLGKFLETNDNVVSYIGYEEEIKVSDCWKLSKQLYNSIVG